MVAGDSQTRASGGRSPSRNALPSTLGFDRAPRLRRIAALIDEAAPDCSNPAKARALACVMRLRASELEAGVPVDRDDEMMGLIGEMDDG